MNIFLNGGFSVLFLNYDVIAPSFSLYPAWDSVSTKLSTVHTFSQPPVVFGNHCSKFISQQHLWPTVNIVMLCEFNCGPKAEKSLKWSQWRCNNKDRKCTWRTGNEATESTVTLPLQMCAKVWRYSAKKNWQGKLRERLINTEGAGLRLKMN